MKKLIAAAFLTFAFAPAHAAPFSSWNGRLDLTPDFSAFGSRSFTSNAYIAGVSKPVWNLNRAQTPEARIDAWVAGGTANPILGGLQLTVPGGGIQQIASLFTSNPKIAQYASYVQDGVDIGYDPARIHGFVPAWAGYFVSVGVGSSGN